MGHKCWIAMLVALFFPVVSVQANPSCYIVDRDGLEHRISCWSRMVAREVEPENRDRGQLFTSGVLDSPGPLTAFVYQGAMIPLQDLQYMLPVLGVYVLRDGHVIEASPLAECGFSREHRFADLEHPRHRSTAAGLDMPSPPNVPLLLEVFIEFAATDTIAGYPVSDPGLLPISDARIVVFEPESMAAARESWLARAKPSDSDFPFSPYRTQVNKRTDLYRNPEDGKTGRMEKGTRVEVLEIRDEWMRVRVEGWVKTRTVEEKKP
ncbi:MAG: hypothetical protein KAW17_00830 [Candidatus Eisenbacteria sp.]|nr:hypothetical protein [Candidatus Eisenbacteria bacterium]